MFLACMCSSELDIWSVLGRIRAPCGETEVEKRGVSPPRVGGVVLS
jgi:hypothetical protein